MESDLVQHEKLESNTKLLQAEILALVQMSKIKKVEELVDAIKRRRLSSDGGGSVSVEQIREAILALEHEEKIRLIEPPSQGSFLNIFKSFYSALSLWLSLIVISISLIGIYSFPDTLPFSIARMISAGISVLFIPGYGLVGLIFPRREISLIEQVGLSVMLSLAIIAVLWITLDRLHSGADINTVVISTTIAGSLLIIAGTYNKFQVSKVRRENNRT